MANSRTFDEYNPAVEWSRSAEADAVRISLPGFKREDIRVLVDNHGHLRTHGERHVAGNRWSRFQTDVDLPANCNADGIRAKFENDRLTITLPKNTPSAPIPPAPRRPHMAAPSQRLPPAVAEPAARPAAPRPPVPAAPLPPAPAPSVKPPAEPRPSMPRKQSAFVPALAPAPAPLAPVPSVKPPVEPRPSMPKNPYAPVPAPAPAPQVEQPATTTKPAQSSLGAVHRPEEQEDRQRKREEEGKMAEDKKETVHEKKDTEQQRQQEKAMLAEKEMAFANQPRPAFASQGLLVNVAIAVVVLLGVTVHLWLSLRNATGGAGEHGHGPRAPGGR